MNLGDLKTFSRFYTRALKTIRIEDSDLTKIIQKGVDDICIELGLVNADEKFSVSADIYRYSLITNVTRFLAINEGGLWWNAGSASSPDWKQLIPETMESMNQKRPNWRNLGTGDPKWYFPDGEDVIIVPVPDTDLTDGFWLWFNQAPQRMTDDSHYPFGFTAENKRLGLIDDLILKYVEWKVEKAVGDKQISLTAFQEYEALKIKCRKILSVRLDIRAYQSAKFQGKKA